MSDLLTPVELGSFTTTRLGLGTARLGAFWQGRKIDEGVLAVRSAVDHGIGLIDTADVYARGLSERIVRRALGARQGVVVMTKVGLLKTPLGLARAASASGARPNPSGLRRAASAATCFESAYVLQSARASMKRLGRDTLDVLLLHEPTAVDLRAQRFGEAMEHLTNSGAVRQWGASVRDEDAALAALELPGLSWLQIPANLETPAIAAAVAAHPRSSEVVTIALGVLGDGSMLAAGRAEGRTPMEMVPEMLTGALALPGIDAALLGMSTPDHVVSNLAALKRYDLRTKGRKA